MATIPQIAMGFRQPEVASPLNMMAQVSQIQAAQDANALRQFQMQQALRQQEQENALAAMPYSTLAATPQEALRYGAPGRQLYESLLKGSKEKREAELAEARIAGENIKTARASLGGVSDQSTFDAWRANTVKLLPGLAGALPTAYSPEAVRKLALDADKLYENVTSTLNLGRVQTVVQTPKYGGGLTRPVGTFAETPTELDVARTAQAQAAAGASRAQAQRDRVPMSVQEFEAYRRMTPKEQAAFTAFQATKRPQTTIQMPPGEKAEEVKRGEKFVKQEIDVGNAAAAARKSLAGIQSAQDVISKGFDTGFLTETKAKAASVLAALGVADADKYATDSQKFLQAVTERALAAQTEQKGVQTNQDYERIAQSGARMGNTKAANEFILDVARAQAERAIAHDKFYRDWLRDPENKNSLRGAEDAWLESEGNKSIFESPRLKKYGVLESERMQTTPAPQGPVVGGRSATPRGTAPSAAPAMSAEQRAAALEWARANPNDPRTAAVLERLGVR